MKTNTKNLGIHCVWTAVLLILLGESAAAQSLSKYISPNAPTSGSITYNSISSSGYALPSWRNDTAGTYNVDDDRSYSIPIGFDFWYIGQRYTTVNVSTNGYIDFSSETWDGGPGIGWRQYNPYGPYSCDLSSTARPSYYGGGTVLSNGTALAIAPFLFDLTTQYNVDPLGDGIKYLVGGTAPNRTLTVEWYTMGVYTNTTPSLNFQVVLHEGSGQIEFNYGTMTAGTYANWHYAVGMSGANVNSSHLVEATANTPSSFSTSSTQWQLATLPTSNSQIVFTPPAVSAPTNYGDTNVTQTSMMIKWSNPTDANRLGFAVYRSDDGGATYNFIRTVASTATSSTESGLLSGVTYYWKIYAYSEGALSTPLIGFRATSAPTNFVSITSGSWSNGATWNAGGTIPNISSSVTIADGHTVTIDTTVANAANITVGQGGGSASTLLIGGSNAIARTINVTGDITVRANGILRANTASVTTGHIINAMGNFYNNGTIDLAPSGSSACSVNFNKAGGQTISGPGTQTNFYKMTLNMGSSSANVLDVFSSNFTDATSGFLTINNGTFRLSTSATVTPFSAGANIPIQGGFWLNAAGTVNTAGNLQVTGNLRVSNGTLNIGSATDHSLISNGGTFLFEGGVANVSGIFRPLNDFTLTTFTMMGGTLNVATVGSTSTTNAPFTIRVPGSSFEMTGGLIVIKQGTSTGLGYVNTGTSRSVVLGGTLQMFDGTAATPTLAKIKTDVPVYNLVVNSLSASAAQLDSLPLTVKANVSIQGSASLRANYLDLFVGGDWTSSGGFFPTAARVTFNGLSSQTITDPIAGVNFYNWTINKAAGSVLMSGNVTVNGAFALSQGTLNVQSSTLTLDSAATSAGTLSMSTTAPFGTVQYLQPLAGQIILAANYGNLTLNAYSKTFPAGTVGVAHTLTVPNPATSHVLTGNTIDFNGSAPQSVAGTTANFIYNNLTMSGAGAKTATGATTINGLLTVSSGVSFADGGNSITAKANVINQGTHSGTGSLQLTPGSAAHQLSGTGQYGNLTINDGNGATLAANLIVSGALTLTSGVINASTYTVKILQGGSVSPGPGYVQGRMQRFFDASTLSQVFAIGDVAGYTPATVQFAAVTNPGGYLTVNTTNGDHANVASSTIDGSNSVNRYWTVASDGFVFSTYSAAFTYVAADVDVPGNELTFKVGRYNAGWTYPTLGTVNSTSAQGTGITYASGFGDFAIGGGPVSSAYRSTNGGGTWATNATWERFNGTSWVGATTTPTSTNAASITIRAGHTVTVQANVTIDHTYIEPGGTLIVNNKTLTLANSGTNVKLNVDGILQVDQGSSISTDATNRLLTILDGGTYRHNYTTSAGTVPVATWAAGSTCEIVGYTSNNNSIAGVNQSFYNFTWNCTNQGNVSIDMAGATTTINGALTIKSTGSGTGELRYATTQSTALTIAGNYVHTGGTFVLTSGTGSPTVTVNGNFNMTAGAFTMSSGGGTGTMKLKGNFSQTAGTIQETSSGRGAFVFNATGTQVFTSAGTILNSIDFTVNSGSILRLDTNVVRGGGNFTLSSGAGIILGSPNGISSTLLGNVRVTGTRTFDAVANYTYTSSAAAQSTGDQLPATVNSLTIDNTYNTNPEVLLTQSTAVTNALSLVNGKFRVSTKTLTLSGPVTTTNGSILADSGTVNYAQASNGQSVIATQYGTLIFSNFNKTLPQGVEIGIRTAFTPGTATGHTIVNSTFNYYGTSQNVAGFAYNNLKFSTSGWKQLTGTASVSGDLTVASNITFSDSIYTLTVNGNISNAGAHTGAGRIYLYGGSASHSLTGGGSYTNLEINDGANATISDNSTINGTFSITRGVVSTPDTINISSAGQVYRPTTGLQRHVSGYLKKYIAASGTPVTVTFEVGSGNDYAPVVLTFATVTNAGTIAISTVGQDHSNIGSSGIDASRNANRFWNLTAFGISYSSYNATFNFQPTDLDPTAATAYFFVKRYVSSSWLQGISTDSSRTATSTRALAVTGVGQFVVGNIAPIIYWTRGNNTPNWSDAANWSTYSLPTINNDVVFQISGTVDVNTAAVCRSIRITNSTVTLTVKTGYSLTVADSIIQNTGVFAIEEGYPTVSGGIALNGGTFMLSGSGAQSIRGYNYNNLICAGSNTKTAIAAFKVAGDLTINSGSTFAAASYTDTLYGNWINNGVFTPGTSAIAMAGSAGTSISGSSPTTFNALTINKTSGSLVVSLGTSATAATVNVNQGRIETGSNSITVTSSRTGNGYIYGRIIHSHTFTEGTAYSFEGPNNLVTFTGLSLPTAVTEDVVLASPGATVDLDPINRYYRLEFTGGSAFTYAYRFHYQSGEIASPNTMGSLKLWKENSSGSNTWDRRDSVTSADSSSQYYVQLGGLTQADTGRWTLSSRGQAKLVLTLAQSKSNPAPGDTLTYTITWDNKGDGSATNSLLTTQIPTNTTYFANSLKYNGTATSTGVTIGPSSITININTLIGNVPIPSSAVDPTKGKGTVTYIITIN